MGKLVDRTGHRYGMLAVLGRDDAKPSAANGRRVYWLCRCDCGVIKSATGHDLHAGLQSCGCAHWMLIGAKKRTHGLTRTRTYYSWQAAKGRCHNPKNGHYRWYGARGIRMCKRWRDSFEAFLSDMGECPPGKTIDRRDGREGYAPGNCRWATPREQARNTTRAKKLSWRGRADLTIGDVAEMEGLPRTTLGKNYRALRDIAAAVEETRQRLKRGVTLDGTTMNMIEWSKRTGLPRETIRSRLRKGWTVHEALSHPHKLRRAHDGVWPFRLV